MIKPNILHAYPSWTYNLSLHAIPRESNTFPPSSFTVVPEHVLIASGYRYTPIFGPTIFFDRMSFTNIVAASNKGRDTTALSMNFTIIETNGCTLMNRILEKAYNMHYDNPMEMPLMMQIDFLADNDAGEPVLIKATKYLPIQITQMKMKISAKGSEYQCSAVPYSESALFQAPALVQAVIEGYADTVGNLFGDGPHSLKTAINRIYKKLADDNRTIYYDEYDFIIDSDIADRYITPPEKTPHDAKGFAAATPGAGASSGVDPAKANMSKAPQPNAQQQARSAADDAAPTTNKISIPAGKTISDILSQVIAASSYVRDQLDVTSDPGVVIDPVDKENVNWFRVATEVKIKDYDPTTNKCSKKYTYRVIKSKVFQTQIAEAPIGLPPDPDKEYFYIFTGKNLDVLDFDLNFDTLFTTTKSISALNANSVNGYTKDIQPNPAPSDEEKINAYNQKIAPNSITWFNPTVSYVQSSLAERLTPHRDQEALIAAQLRSTIYSKSAGDKLQVNLKIIGDPMLIKQDGIFTQAGVPDSGENPSITFEDKQVFCRVIFKSPADYDWDGIARPDITAAFSGLFLILTVENTFQGGKFEQTLKLIRQPDQPDPAYTIPKEDAAETAKLNRLHPGV